MNLMNTDQWDFKNLSETFIAESDYYTFDEDGNQFNWRINATVNVLYTCLLCEHLLYYHKMITYKPDDENEKDLLYSRCSECECESHILLG